MTSMPASRSAMATTLAPRSWPSRPGLATRTRMGLAIMRLDVLDQPCWRLAKVLRCAQDDMNRRLARLDYARRLVFAEDPAQGVADLADGGVGANRVEDWRHKVGGAGGGFGHGGKGSVDGGGVAAGAELGQAGDLALGQAGIEPQGVGRRRL